MEPDESPVRNIPSAALAFLASLAAYWVAWTAAHWLTPRLTGGGLASARVLGGLVLPALLVLLGWRQKGRGPALHAFLIFAAFAGTLAAAVARHLPPSPAAAALVRMMGYAFAGAALHASLVNAVTAAHGEPVMETNDVTEPESFDENGDH